MADHECFIGITGWLRACRQAYVTPAHPTAPFPTWASSQLLTPSPSYVEGTATLYTINAFHISHLPLLLNLPRLLPPHHLATITTLELLWDFFGDRATIQNIYSQAQQPPSPTTSDSPTTTTFHALCHLTPRHFPNVRRLYLALQADVTPPALPNRAAMLPLFEKAFLAPVEAMFRALRPRPHTDFSFAMQATGYQVLAWRQGRRPLDEEGLGDRWEYEYCHPERLRMRTLRVRMGTDLGEAQRAYWVREGVRFEVSRAWMPLGGEGGWYWLRPGWTDPTGLLNGRGLDAIWGTMGLWD